MKSPKELRAEAHDLIERARSISDPELKMELVSQALALSQRAEAIATEIANPDMIEKNIRRYQSWLSGGLSEEGQRKTVEAALADAEELSRDLRHAKRSKKSQRRCGA